MNKAVEYLRKFRNRSRSYFHGNRDEITRYNISTLLLTSSIAFFLVLFFFILTPYIVDNWHVTWEYIALLPLFGVFAIVSLFLKHRTPSYKAVQSLCIAFYVLTMLLFILISVFPFPNGNDVFVGLSIMILPVLLILRQYQVLMITVGMGALHIVLAIMFKDPSTLGHDVFETIAAVLLSEAISLPIFNLRLSNFSTQQELKRISSLDSLTGIFNRSSIENEAKQFLEGKIVPSGWAIAMLDIDCFKSINDVYGHKQGDDVLTLLGQKLKALQSEFISTGRVGGDEFMILFKAQCDRGQISN